MSRPITTLLVVGAILIAVAAMGLLGENSVLVGRPALAQTNTLTAASGQIAFEAYRDGNSEIYVMNADGSGVTRLTNNSTGDYDPAWSPDGRRIAFGASRDGNLEIYVMNADGSGVTNLTNNPAYDSRPAWSPGGRFVAFDSYRDGNFEIYFMKADGSAVTRLTNNPALDSHPAWSPDGRRIAFKSDRDGNFEIYVLGGVTTRLTNNPARDSHPAWSYPDGNILEIFYDATGGDDWTNSTNWLSDRPLGEWHGVTTDGLGRVTRLYLPENNLTGSIPPELTGLTWLDSLVLATNQLGGEIPPELGGFSNLTRLLLGSNQLSGEIPPELGSLTDLTHLQLGVNQLSGSIPPELGGLARLQYLHLRDNQLTGSVPAELGGLFNLRSLALERNQLTGSLPLSLTGLTVLQSFLFIDNDWLCAPVDGAFQQWLKAVPNTDGGPNCSDGNILARFYRTNGGANWTNDTNWLSDRPLGEWHGVTTDAEGRVTGLLLKGNNLTGTIPSELGSLSSLTELNLRGNQLSGEIPPVLGGLTNLTLLELSLNRLSGGIPPELGGLSNLTGLYLGYNQLSGEIPPELGKLSNLTVLALDGNRLSGEIPPELGSLSNLTGLALDRNRLTGSLPLSLTRLTGLERFWFTGNAGLCAPTDDAFQRWLKAIPNRDDGPNCIDYDPDDDGLIEVSTLAQLDAIRWDLDGDGSATDAGYARAFPSAASGMGCPSAGCIGYELAADLDFDTDDSGWASAGDAYWNKGAGWTPIGRGEGNGFSAVFEGNGRAIDSLYVNTTDANAGLFSVVAEGGAVRNVRLESVNVSGQARVGGLAGDSRGTISGIRVTGIVAGRNAVGGLVGTSRAAGVIVGSHAAASVTGTAPLSDGGRDVGGLVGVNRGGVRGSYATGSVSGRAENTGGLVGFLYGGSIVASYAAGPVSSGGRYVGGLVGSSWGDITASYAVGSVVAGVGNVGGLVGYRGSGAVTASYWDTETSGQARSPAGQGKTTAELKRPTGYTGIYADCDDDIATGGDDPWDFGTASEYPVLKDLLDL